MGPGFHLLYARRLAWRHRLLLALPLALLGFLHPFFALASLVPFLLPARLWEGRALKAIAQASLAYPTALAYGEARLWEEAKRVRLPLPPFPTGLLLAYLFALLLALTLAAWRTPWSPGNPWPFPGSERHLGPEGASRPPGNPEGRGSAEGKGETPQLPPKAPPPEPGSTSPGPGEPSSRGEPSLQGPKESQGPATPSPGTQTGQPSGEGAATAPSGKAGGPRSGQGASPPQGSPGREGFGGGPGPSGPPPALPVNPQGPEEGLLRPGGTEGATPLPTPWPGGKPPEGVRRGVEVYLERTPLSPEAREVLRRYFSGP